MVSFNAILEAGRELLEGRFPGETVYVNLAPSGFTRPSFLAALGEIHMEDAGADTLALSLPLELKAFVEVDSYHHSHIPELITRTAAVMELFAVSGLRVGDRVLGVAETRAEYNYDYADITVLLSYHDDRPGGEDWPLMGEITTKTELKEG